MKETDVWNGLENWRLVQAKEVKSVTHSRVETANILVGVYGASVTSKEWPRLWQFGWYRGYKIVPD